MTLRLRGLAGKIVSLNRDLARIFYGSSQINCSRPKNDRKSNSVNRLIHNNSGFGGMKMRRPVDSINAARRADEKRSRTALTVNER